MKKQYVVFGAGRFGRSIAVTLQMLGSDVIVVDRNPEVIQEIADEVSYALCANVEDTEIFRELGLSNVNGAIISMAGSLEASIITAMTCSEMGIPRIIAKARNQLHEKILRSVGVHEVIYPEVAMGQRLARHLVADNFSDWIDLSPSYSLVEMKLPQEWCGKCLAELRVREKYGVNVIGIKEHEDVCINPDPKEPLRGGSVLIVVGGNEALEALET